MPLTQETLTMHNSFISSHMSFDFDLKQPEIEQSLFDRVDEQCKTMKQEFDEKISVSISTKPEKKGVFFLLLM